MSAGEHKAVTMPMSRLSEYERQQVEAKASKFGDPYAVLARKIEAVARFLHCDEATAQAIVLMQIDRVIQYGMHDVADEMQRHLNATNKTERTST